MTGASNGREIRRLPRNGSGRVPAERVSAAALVCAAVFALDWEIPATFDGMRDSVATILETVNGPMTEGPGYVAS